MTIHHFVPLSIICTFASDQSWRLVEETPEKRASISRIDKKTIESGQKRNWPVCVYEKKNRRFIRKRAGCVCSMPNLYGVTNNSDPLIRGIIQYILHDDTQIQTISDLLRLGEEPIESNVVEREYVAKMDASFASILPKLRASKVLSSEEIRVILHFLTFQRFRTPWWRRIQFAEAYKKIQYLYMQPFLKDWDNPHFKEITRRNINALNNAIDSILYQIAIIMAITRETPALQKLNAKLIVLHNSGKVPFITCDNPCRPYFHDRIRRIAIEPIPGMIDQRSQITYPIDPRTCLFITTESKFPNFGHIEVSEKQVRKINCALAQMAENEVIFEGPDISVFEDWFRLSTVELIRRP